MTTKEGKIMWKMVFCETGVSWTDKMEVPGGWIVRTYMRNVSAVAMVFVPDPDHLWNPGKK